MTTPFPFSTSSQASAKSLNPFAASATNPFAGQLQTADADKKQNGGEDFTQNKPSAESNLANGQLKPILKKVQQIRRTLMNSFIERDDMVSMAIVALVAKQHLLVIGPPGTAKSAVFMQLSKMIAGMEYFQTLLTPFSTPEEVFGPLSLPELEKGNYLRNPAGMLPTAHTAFLDEVFKANSSILNSLLTIINERIFYNGHSAIKAPLMTLFAASNEYPEDESLGALFDRFMIRLEVDYIGDDNNFMKMLMTGNQKPSQMITLEEIQYLQNEAEQVVIGLDIAEVLANIRRELKDEGIRPSDRRFQTALSILRAVALLNGSTVVKVKHLQVLAHVLWMEPDKKAEVAKIISKYASDPVELEINNIVEAAKGLKESLSTIGEDELATFGIESNKKLRNGINSLKKLKQKFPTREIEVNQAIEYVSSVNEEILKATVGIDGDEGI